MTEETIHEAEIDETEEQSEEAEEQSVEGE